MATCTSGAPPSTHTHRWAELPSTCARWAGSIMRDGPRIHFFIGGEQQRWLAPPGPPIHLPPQCMGSSIPQRRRKTRPQPPSHPHSAVLRPKRGVVADWILRWRGCPYQLVPTWDDACHEPGPTSSSKQEKILEISFFLRAQLERCDSLLGPDKH